VLLHKRQANKIQKHRKGNEGIKNYYLPIKSNCRIESLACLLCCGGRSVQRKVSALAIALGLSWFTHPCSPRPPQSDTDWARWNNPYEGRNTSQASSMPNSL